MEWNEATATEPDINTHEFDVHTPTEGFQGAEFPLKDARFWVVDQQSPQVPAQMPDAEGGGAPVEKSGEASEPPPPIQSSGSGRGKQTILIGSLAVLALALLLSVASLLPTRQKLAATTLPPPPPVEPPLEKEDTEKCIEQLELSASNLKTTLKASSPTVQAAFKHHFTPFDKGLQIRGDNVWDILDEQVDHLLLGQPNEGFSEEEKEDFLKNAQLLRAICDASSERLRELGRLESTATEHGIPIPLIDVSAGDDRPDFDFDDSTETAKPVTFKEFLNMLPKPKEEYLALAATAGDAVVPRKVAATLADLIRIEDIQSEDDNYICEHFDRFASTFGFRLGSIDNSAADKAPPLSAVFDVRPFNTSEFFKFLKYRYERTLESYMDPLIFHHLAKNWNRQRVEELIEQTLDDQRRRTQDLIQQKVMTLLGIHQKGWPENTLLMISMFLL